MYSSLVYSDYCRRGGAEVAGWTLDRKIRVRFPAYPHRVWALWWQGGNRRLRTSRCPCPGRLGTLKTPSCPWHGCPAAGQNLETGHLSRHYIAEISLNVTLNHKQQQQHWLLVGTPTAFGPQFAFRWAEHRLLLRMSLGIFNITLITTNICVINLLSSKPRMDVGSLSLYGALFIFLMFILLIAQLLQEVGSFGTLNLKLTTLLGWMLSF